MASGELLNRFQQRIPESEQKLINGKIPFRIVKLNELLGDQISSAHRLEYSGDTYFLNANGVEEIKAGLSIKMPVFQPDTIIVVASGKIRLFTNPERHGNEVTLNKGESFVRYVRYKGSFYLIRLGSIWSGGWSSLEPPGSWEITKTPGSNELVKNNFNREFSEISLIVDGVNSAYSRHFKFMNIESGQNFTAPFWKVIKTDTTIVVTFTGTSEQFGALEQSTAVFAGRIKNAILGRKLIAEMADNKIMIRQIESNVP
jgi:hypothetical protein